MSHRDLLELLIILVIVIGFGAAIWKGGARNPVGTGGLDKKLTALSGEVRQMNQTIGSKVDEIETRLEAVEREAVTAKDIARIEKAVDKLAKALPDLEGRLRAQAEKQGEHAQTSAATAATVQQMSKQLDLIMSVVVPKGMEK